MWVPTCVALRLGSSTAVRPHTPLPLHASCAPASPLSATVSCPRRSLTTHTFVLGSGAGDEVYEMHEDDEEEEEEEYVYVGEAWERGAEGCGLCFFHCRDPGELDDEENG